MRSILFVHDHPFRRVNGQIYSTGGLNDQVLSRYAKYCESLTVVARIIEEQSVNDRWSLISNPKVHILGEKTKFWSGLEHEVKTCDKMIVRLPSTMGIRALEINKKYNKPYLIEMVGCAWDALWNHSLKGKILAPIMFFINRRLIKNAPFVVYVTQEYLQKRYPSTGRTIGCSDVEIDEMDESVISRKVEQLKEDKIKYKIGTVAAIDVPYKGQEYVIRALGELNKKGINCYEYWLVGNGNADNLKHIADICNIGDRVHFVGGIPHEKVFSWLDTIDLYIQPSTTEGLPRALIEAMSRGIPALGSSVGGIPELLRDKYLFKKGDYMAIASILASIKKTELINMSTENFTKAHEYQKNLLDRKREDFYRLFLSA